MMTRTLLLTAVALSPITASLAADGERVSVSAGEHRDYSRLVFDKGVENVRLERNGRTVKLRNLDPSVTFSFQEINEGRKAFRVLRADYASGSSNQTVTITLNCDCAVETATLNNGKFVLDVISPTKKSAPIARPGKNVLNDPAETPKVAEENSATARAGTAGLTEKQKAEMLSVEQAHSRMVELLKQAAREGLVTIRDDASGPAGAATGANSEGTESTSKHAQNSNTESENAHIAEANDIEDKNTTLVEQPREEQSHEEYSPEQIANEKVAPVTQASHESSPGHHYTCYKDSELFINGAPFDEEPLVKITDLRTALTEADTNNRAQIIRDLTAGFLSVGFGDEALSMLNDYKKGETAHAEIARALAERPFPSSSRLMNAKECRGMHALWQAAASEPGQAVALYNRFDGAQGHLPKRLREMIAARLAIKMIDAKDFIKAEALYAVAIEGVEQPGPELEYINARLDEHAGETGSSREKLLELATDNSIASDDALLALAESYNSNVAKPHDGYAEDIGALAKIHETPRAAFAEAGVWADLGNLEAALTLLSGVSRNSPRDLEKAQNDADRILGNALASNDTSAKVAAIDTFLKHQHWMRTNERNRALSIEVAEAAHAQGLPNLAYSLLDGMQPDNKRETLLKKANAALASDDFDKAVMLAAPYAIDPAFGAIVAEANMEKGAHHAALAATAAVSDGQLKSQLMSRAGWLARAWDSAAKGYRGMDPNALSDTAAFKFALAAYMAGEQATPAAAQAILAKGQSALTSGVEAMFADTSGRTALERSKKHVDQTNTEIEMFKEVLGDG